MERSTRSGVRVGTVESRLHVVLATRRRRVTPAAREAGLSPSSAQALAGGRQKRVDLDVLARWCALLGCGVADLLVYVAPPEDGTAER
jgi:DNA-binding Xre family transcriptional regulator